MKTTNYGVCGVELNGLFKQFLCLGKNQIEVVEV